MDIASFETKEALTLVLTLVISMVQSWLPHMHTYTSQLLAFEPKKLYNFGINICDFDGSVMLAHACMRIQANV